MVIFYTLLVVETLIIVYLANMVRRMRRKDRILMSAIASAPNLQPSVQPNETLAEPVEARSPNPQPSEQAFLERLTSVVYAEMEQGKVEVETLAEKMFLSRSQLNRKVKMLTGMSTSNYSINLRLKRACELLHSGTDISVSEVATRCGFEDPAYFTRIFKQRVGKSPTVYRKSKDDTNDLTDEDSNTHDNS